MYTCKTVSNRGQLQSCHTNNTFEIEAFDNIVQNGQKIYNSDFLVINFINHFANPTVLDYITTVQYKRTNDVTSIWRKIDFARTAMRCTDGTGT